MRKRKLYVSEMLRKHKSRYCEVVLVFEKDQDSITFEDTQSALYTVEQHEKQYGETLIVKEWYYSDYYGITIFIE